MSALRMANLNHREGNKRNVKKLNRYAVDYVLVSASLPDNFFSDNPEIAC